MVEEESIATSSKRPGIVSRIRQKLTHANWEEVGRQHLGLLCFFVLVAILMAGLWPFHSPRNQVRWLAGGNGLRFGRYGTILSSRKFQSSKAQEKAACTIEVWLQPAFTAGGGTILSFYAPESPRQFSLHQSISDLLLRSTIPDGRYRTRTAGFYVADIFRQGKPLFITIASNGVRTSVYLDGELAETAPRFPLSGRDLEGYLVIANWPRMEDSWSGILRGLAFYAQELSPAQVLYHYETWTNWGRPDVSEDEGALAVYLFNEHAGRLIHNEVPSGTDLYIPDRYLVLDEVFFRPFWEEYHPGWSYWNDVFINIAGFIPLGFIFCAYFSMARRIERPALVTILLGFVVSLTIESLQAFMPTRDSGTTDLFTNTLGTSLGVALCSCSKCRALIAKLWAHLVGILGKGQVESPTH